MMKNQLFAQERKRERVVNILRFMCLTVALCPVALGQLALMHRWCDSMINCVAFSGWRGGGGQTKPADGYVRSPQRWLFIMWTKTDTPLKKTHSFNFIIQEVTSIRTFFEAQLLYFMILNVLIGRRCVLPCWWKAHESSGAAVRNIFALYVLMLKQQEVLSSVKGCFLQVHFWSHRFKDMCMWIKKGSNWGTAKRW